MKNYCVISSGELNDFTRACFEALNEGWIPQGGVCISPGGNINTPRFLQAFIK